MNNLSTSRFLVEIDNLVIYTTISCALTMFLFYIDEGYYNFEWMSNPGAWFVFSLYSLLFVIILLLFDAFTFRKYQGNKKAAFSLLSFSSLLLLFLVYINL